MCACVKGIIFVSGQHVEKSCSQWQETSSKLRGKTGLGGVKKSSDEKRLCMCMQTFFFPKTLYFLVSSIALVSG